MKPWTCISVHWLKAILDHSTRTILLPPTFDKYRDICNKYYRGVCFSIFDNSCAVLNFFGSCYFIVTCGKSHFLWSGRFSLFHSLGKNFPIKLHLLSSERFLNNCTLLLNITLRILKHKLIECFPSILTHLNFSPSKL